MQGSEDVKQTFRFREHWLSWAHALLINTKRDERCYSMNAFYHELSLPSASSPPSPRPSPPRWSSGPPCTSAHNSASWSLLRWLPASQRLWWTGGSPGPPGDTVIRDKDRSMENSRQDSKSQVPPGSSRWGFSQQLSLSPRNEDLIKKLFTYLVCFDNWTLHVAPESSWTVVERF